MLWWLHARSCRKWSGDAGVGIGQLLAGWPSALPQYVASALPIGSPGLGEQAADVVVARGQASLEATRRRGWHRPASWSMEKASFQTLPAPRPCRLAGSSSQPMFKCARRDVKLEIRDAGVGVGQLRLKSASRVGQGRRAAPALSPVADTAGRRWMAVAHRQLSPKLRDAGVGVGQLLTDGERLTEHRKPPGQVTCRQHARHVAMARRQVSLEMGDARVRVGKLLDDRPRLSVCRPRPGRASSLPAQDVADVVVAHRQASGAGNWVTLGLALASFLPDRQCLVIRRALPAMSSV